MNDYCCPFCGQNHGPDPRANRRPCPKVRALKYDSDGTISHFKLVGQKGWVHKGQMHKPFQGLDRAIKAADPEFQRIAAAMMEAGE